MVVQRDLLGSKGGEAVEGSLRIWQENDRLLVELRAVGAPAVTDVHGEELHRRELDTLFEEETADVLAPGDDPDMFAKLTEADWLRAELVVLQKEAVARADSLDATLAYVSERCAAVGRS